MISSSEWVSNGHPDRLCDAIAANLINRIQKKDKGNSHAAVEVFASKDTIVFGGEVKTSLKINKSLLKEIIAETFKDCGYGPERREIFTKEQVRLAKDTKIINLIHAQSPDIAIATTDKGENGGFNDQGIFFGAYCNRTPTGQGIAKWLAQDFGEYLFEMSKNQILFKMGSDIKTVFTLEVAEDGMTPITIKSVIVAVPHCENVSEQNIKELVVGAYKAWARDSCIAYKEFIKIYNVLSSSTEPEFIVNGTGRYVNHGYSHDASMTGRKLAVNNMSAGPVWSMCQNGGGSYVKPFHASDFLLPMVANKIAKTVVDAGYSSFVNVSSSCAIGQSNIQGITITGDEKYMSNKELRQKVEKFFTEEYDFTPSAIISDFKIFSDDFDFYKMVKNNFVGNCCPYNWNTELVKKLKEYCE